MPDRQLAQPAHPPTLLTYTFCTARLMVALMVPCMPSTRRCSQTSMLPLASTGWSNSTFSPCWLNISSMRVLSVCRGGGHALVKRSSSAWCHTECEPASPMHPKYCWCLACWRGPNTCLPCVVLVGVLTLLNVTLVRLSNRPDWKCGTTLGGSEPSDRISSSVGSDTK